MLQRPPPRDRASPAGLQWLWVSAAIGLGGLAGAAVLDVVDAWLSSTDAVAPWTRKTRGPDHGPRLAKPAADPAPEPQQTTERPRRVRSRKQPPAALPDFTSMYDWPHEPNAPDDVDDARFTEALAMLCGPDAEHEVRKWYAGWILRAAREFGADPFLLGALMFRQSGCSRQPPRPTGLTDLAYELYADDVHDGVYHYRAFDQGRWLKRELSIKRFPFEPRFVAQPESNLYFAAAFLRAWREQRRGLFAAFVQKEYRHHVSHFLWGDEVGSARQENWILVDRRRLLEYYGARTPAAPVAFRGFALGCPLDGCPRLVTSTLGDVRAGGKRAHRGTDFESSQGEPVRAVADGEVLFAGVDWPGKGQSQRIPIYAQRSLQRSIMGAGGLYVCIRHRPKGGGDGLISCYMHLDTATVSQGRRVQRGEQIGKVGRTGIKVSAPHLHFELHAADGVLPAEKALGPLALGRPPVHEAPPPEAAARRPEAPRPKPQAAQQRKLKYLDF